MENDNSDLEYMEQKYAPILKEVFDNQQKQNPDLTEEEFYEKIAPKIVESIMQHNPNDEGFEDKVKSHLSEEDPSQQENSANEHPFPDFSEEEMDLIRTHLEPDQYKRFLELQKED
jgi:hypothetical protein